MFPSNIKTTLNKQQKSKLIYIKTGINVDEKLSVFFFGGINTSNVRYFIKRIERK